MNPGFSKFSKVVLSKVFVAYFYEKCPMDTFLGTGVALKIKRSVFQCLFVFLGVGSSFDSEFATKKVKSCYWRTLREY